MVPLVALAVLLAQAQAPQRPPSGDDLAAAAKAVFAAKCVQCHGPEVPHPKAGFGFITDLRRLVGSGKYIVPGQPEKSEIWNEISEGDMPPEGAKAGPLTQAETDAILAWIVAAAPVPQDGPSVNPPIETHDSQATPKATSQGVVRLVGRVHVIVVHFPVALLISGALAELWASLRRVRSPIPAVRFCVWVGAISALAAGGLGWVHALDGFPGPSANPLTTAGLHRWIGTAAAVLAPLVALLVERDARQGRRTPRARGAIFVLAAAVALAGHFGGLLTHGPGFFDP